MPSNARKKFDDNAGDIYHLIDLYKGAVSVFEFDGDEIPEGYEVVFRSAVVLMVSHWEAYVEDICGEALDHMVTHVKDPGKLPKEMKKQVAKEVKAAQNEIEVWELANQGWKNYIRERMPAFRQARERSFNTPKAQNTAEFIKLMIGIDDIRKAWIFDGKDKATVGRQLDDLIKLRGEIAHRGRLPKRLDADFVTAKMTFLRKLVSKTGGRINTHVKQVTGIPLYKSTG